jgi:hypothetical protein
MKKTVIYHKDGDISSLWNASKVMLDHLLTQSTTALSNYREGSCSDGTETLNFLTRVWANLEYVYRQEEPHIELDNAADNLRRRQFVFFDIHKWLHNIQPITAKFFVVNIN